MKSSIVIAASLLALCAGCAQDPADKTTEVKSQAAYRTGSNIPSGRDTDSANSGSANQASLPPKTGGTINSGQSGR